MPRIDPIKHYELIADKINSYKANIITTNGITNAAKPGRKQEFAFLTKLEPIINAAFAYYDSPFIWDKLLVLLQAINFQDKNGKEVTLKELLPEKIKNRVINSKVITPLDIEFKEQKLAETVFDKSTLFSKRLDSLLIAIYQDIIKLRYDFVWEDNYSEFNTKAHEEWKSGIQKAAETKNGAFRDISRGGITLGGVKYINEADDTIKNAISNLVGTIENHDLYCQFISENGQDFDNLIVTELQNCLLCHNVPVQTVSIKGLMDWQIYDGRIFTSIKSNLYRVVDNNNRTYVLEEGAQAIILKEFEEANKLYKDNQLDAILTVETQIELTVEDGKVIPNIIGFDVKSHCKEISSTHYLKQTHETENTSAQHFSVGKN